MATQTEEKPSVTLGSTNGHLEKYTHPPETKHKREYRGLVLHDNETDAIQSTTQI